jgi:hypothetical protein
VDASDRVIRLSYGARVPVDQEVLDWIRDAAAAAHSWESVSAALRARAQDGEDPRLRPFVLAFDYALHERSSTTRERAGEPFGAKLAGDGWRYPPALEDLTDEDLDAWRIALDAVEHPVARARLGDLLWERKAKPKSHLAARVACDGLVRVTQDSAWRAMDRVRCLSRALELAR